ncbi:hypothetical protein ACXZ9C_10840 [Streptococcus agalactiae]
MAWSWRWSLRGVVAWSRGVACSVVVVVSRWRRGVASSVVAWRGVRGVAWGWPLVGGDVVVVAWRGAASHRRVVCVGGVVVGLVVVASWSVAAWSSSVGRGVSRGRVWCVGG